MTCSIIVRTKDEADRLRLALTSLACQSRPAEIVVVNDGSTDHTVRVLSEFTGVAPLVTVHHREARGRSAASNAGARAATGTVLVFLDGDCLAGPEFVARHEAAHSANSNLVGRGENLNLRCTRFLQDPAVPTPQPGHERRLANMPAAEREGLRVTREQIEFDFACVHMRAMPGNYPGAGPRALYELETSALRNHPDCGVLWAATSGSNLSVDRAAFLDAGGFDESLDNNEHRELGLRLCTGGARIGFVEGARNYHLTHRIGWRDPLVESAWERVFYRRHPIAAVKLLSVLWASLSDNSPIPPHLRLMSLADLEEAARGEGNVDYDVVRRLIPGLPELERGAVL